ncbi:hypothetical protein GCM10022255_107070 [Dactylosporangium darangshiense]|uniref:Uncharacterized protein n=1 Tax=Dactylosporangium darangshiense TaxID=579108 RepID=A0ABP8DTT8_9ACTN
MPNLVTDGVARQGRGEMGQERQGNRPEAEVEDREEAHRPTSYASVLATPAGDPSDHTERHIALLWHAGAWRKQRPVR